MTVVAVIDDWQGLARDCADWSLLGDAEVRFFEKPFATPQAAAEALADANVVVPMRERTRFDANLLERLPNLRMLALTGFNTSHVDVGFCHSRGIAIAGSGSYSPAATAELTIGLLIAAARHLPRADAQVRSGDFQSGMPLGTTLEGRTLGILGLGRIGGRVAAIARAIGMDVLAWSPNLDAARAEAAGVRLAPSKDALFAASDAVTLHMPLSDRSRAIVGKAQLGLMRLGAILVNTARSGLVDQTALIAALKSGQITAALDVFDEEPLPADNIFTTLPKTLLTPHLGFNTRDVFTSFYGQSVENIRAWMAGAPIRLVAQTAETLP